MFIVLLLIGCMLNENFETNWILPYKPTTLLLAVKTDYVLVFIKEEMVDLVFNDH